MHCDQIVLPGMQELMNDHAGRHKLSITHHTYPRRGKDYCKWAEKKGYRNCERMAALIFATAQNGIPVLPNAPSTQIVITEAIRVLHTVEASRDAILTQMQALAKTLPEYSLVREMPSADNGSAPDCGDRRCQAFTASGLSSHMPASIRRRTSPANSARITGISPSGKSLSA